MKFGVGKGCSVRPRTTAETAKVELQTSNMAAESGVVKEGKEEAHNSLCWCRQAQTRAAIKLEGDIRGEYSLLASIAGSD